MTFDEADKIVEAFDEDPELEDWMPDSKVYEIIEGLRKEYAPTVEMTKIQYDYIAPLIKEGQELGATFTEFWEVYKYIGASKKLTPAFKSQEHAMQAWLHPETIKIVDE